MFKRIANYSLLFILCVLIMMPCFTLADSNITQEVNIYPSEDSNKYSAVINWKIDGVHTKGIVSYWKMWNDQYTSIHEPFIRSGDCTHYTLIDGLEKGFMYRYTIVAIDNSSEKYISDELHFLAKGPVSNQQWSDNDLRILNIKASVDFIPLNRLTSDDIYYLFDKRVIDNQDEYTKVIKVKIDHSKDAFCKVLYKNEYSDLFGLNYTDELITQQFSDFSIGYILAPIEGEYHYRIYCFADLENPNRDTSYVYSNDYIFNYKIKDGLEYNMPFRSSTDGGLYIIYNGERYLIQDNYTLLFKGFLIDEVNLIDGDLLKNYPFVGTFYGKLNNGDLIRLENHSSVYLIENNYRRPIISSDIFECLGYNWDEVQIVPMESFDYYLPGNTINQCTDNIFNGSLVSVLNNPAIHFIKDNIKMPFYSEFVFKRYGFDWSDVKTITQDQLDSFDLGDILY